MTTSPTDGTNHEESPAEMLEDQYYSDEEVQQDVVATEHEHPASDGDAASDGDVASDDHAAEETGSDEHVDEADIQPEAEYSDKTETKGSDVEVVEYEATDEEFSVEEAEVAMPDETEGTDEEMAAEGSVVEVDEAEGTDEEMATAEGTDEEMAVEGSVVEVDEAEGTDEEMAVEGSDEEMAVEGTDEEMADEVIDEAEGTDVEMAIEGDSDMDMGEDDESDQPPKEEAAGPEELVVEQSAEEMSVDDSDASHVQSDLEHSDEPVVSKPTSSRNKGKSTLQESSEDSDDDFVLDDAHEEDDDNDGLFIEDINDNYGINKDYASNDSRSEMHSNHLEPLRNAFDAVSRELTYKAASKCFITRSQLHTFAEHPRFYEFCEGAFCGFPVANPVYKGPHKILARICRRFAPAHDDPANITFELQVLTGPGEFDGQEPPHQGEAVRYQVSIIDSADLKSISDEPLSSSMVATFVSRLAQISSSPDHAERHSAVESFFPRACDDPSTVAKVLSSRAEMIHQFAYSEADVQTILKRKHGNATGQKKQLHKMSMAELDVNRDALQIKISRAKKKEDYLMGSLQQFLNCYTLNKSELLKQAKESSIAEAQSVLTEIDAIEANCAKVLIELKLTEGELARRNTPVAATRQRTSSVIKTGFGAGPNSNMLRQRAKSGDGWRLLKLCQLPQGYSPESRTTLWLSDWMSQASGKELAVAGRIRALNDFALWVESTSSSKPTLSIEVLKTMQNSSKMGSSTQGGANRGMANICRLRERFSSQPY